jgi:hypothetical protein
VISDVDGQVLDISCVHAGRIRVDGGHPEEQSSVGRSTGIGSVRVSCRKVIIMSSALLLKYPPSCVASVRLYAKDRLFPSVSRGSTLVDWPAKA